MSNTLKDSAKRLFGHNPNYVFKDMRINTAGNIVYDDNKIITGTIDAGNGKVVNLGGSESQQKEQPEPVQRALNRIKEIDRVTDVRIDEEFKATDFNRAENRLTITIDYLDVDDIVKEMKKADKHKLY